MHKIIPIVKAFLSVFTAPTFVSLVPKNPSYLSSCFILIDFHQDINLNESNYSFKYQSQESSRNRDLSVRKIRKIFLIIFLCVLYEDSYGVHP